MMKFLRGFKLLGVERNGRYGCTSRSTCLYGLDKFCFESSHLAITNYVSQKVHMSQEEGLVNVRLRRKWHDLFICQVYWHYCLNELKHVKQKVMHYCGM